MSTRARNCLCKQRPRVSKYYDPSLQPYYIIACNTCGYAVCVTSKNVNEANLKWNQTIKQVEEYKKDENIIKNRG
jgi:hypothetical protein